MCGLTQSTFEITPLSVSDFDSSNWPATEWWAESSGAKPSIATTTSMTPKNLWRIQDLPARPVDAGRAHYQANRLNAGSHAFVWRRMLVLGPRGVKAYRQRAF